MTEAEAFEILRDPEDPLWQTAFCFLAVEGSPEIRAQIRDKIANGPKEYKEYGERLIARYEKVVKFFKEHSFQNAQGQKLVSSKEIIPFIAELEGISLEEAEQVVNERIQELTPGIDVYVESIH